MKVYKIINKYSMLALLSVSSLYALAGNRDRAGQMGATELNVNPWAATSGLFYGNAAYVTGIEAMKLNVAGLAVQKGTEIGVSFNNYMSGTDVNYINAAFAFGLKGDAKLGVNIMSFRFGSPNIATVENPEQDNTFTPSFTNIGITYSKEFSENVAGGLQATIINESFGNARASGLSLDAGIQYQGGNNMNTHFGVALRNFGPTFSYKGDGFNTTSDNSNNQPTTYAAPTDNINLPTQFILSGSYDIYLAQDNSQKISKDSAKHRLTPAFTFTSNAFYNDQFTLSMDYAFRNKFFLRAGYRFEKNIFSKENNQTLYSGFAGGLGLNFYLNKDERKSPMEIDYAFRMTRFNSGVNSVSIKFLIN